MDCIVCGNPVTVEGSNVCGFACLMKTRLGDMPAWDSRRPRKVGKSGGIAGLVSRIDGMRKSPTPVEQEVPMLILKHSRFRGRNVVINATVFSFDMEGIARVKDLGSARDDLEALLRRDAQVTVLHDPRQPARPVPPTVEEVRAAGYTKPGVAEKIVAFEQAKAAQGVKPYGDKEPYDLSQVEEAAPEPQEAAPEPQEAAPEAQVAQEPTVPQKKPEAPQEAPEAQVEPEVAAPPTEEPVRQPVVKQRRRINKE